MTFARSSARLAGLFATLLVANAHGSAQEQKPQEQPKPAPEAKPTAQKPHLEIPGMNDDQAEMVRLFHEVERTLATIDVELYDASAGRIPAPEGKDSGMERLLRSHGEKSDQAVTGIEQILELAAKMGGQSCSQCMKPGQSPGPGKEGQSPLDQERQRGPSQSEKTPEAPKPDANKPEGQGEKGEKPQPKPGEGKTPDERAKNPRSGENRPDSPRVDEGGNPIQVDPDAERWGNLPERVRQVFQNQITDDLPLQYRDWIDSYYRRLNRTR